MIRSPNAWPACALALAVVYAPLSATAQPSPGNDGLDGPPAPGVCVLSRAAIFADSKVGKATGARLQQLTAEAQTEIDRDRTPLEAEVKGLEAQKATLAPAQYEVRSKPLLARLSAMKAKAEQRNQEIEATRAKAMSRIALETQPLIGEAYRARKCGILFAREAMLGGNPSADLTPAVVQSLDAKLATITFDRETLSQAQPATGLGESR